MLIRGSSPNAGPAAGRLSAVTRSAEDSGRVESQRRTRLPKGTSLFVALSLANLSNYLFQVVASRLLGPSDYSLLGGIFAFVTVVTVSTSALQAAAAKAVAASVAAGSQKAGSDPLTRATMRWGALAGAAVALTSPLTVRFMHSGYGPALALIPYVAAAPVMAVGLGRLQGKEAFRIFGLIALGLALSRLALAPIVVVAGLGVSGVVLLGGLLAAVAAVAALRAGRDAGPIDLRVVKGDIGRASVALVLFWAMVSVDVPVARHWLHAAGAGQYAAAAVVGKAVLWLPSAIALIMFPQVTLQRERGAETHQLLVRSLVVTIALCTMAVLFLRFLGPSVLPLFFGAHYDVASRLAWKVGAVSLPFAVANVLIFYHLTRDTGRFIVALAIAAVVQLGLYALIGHTYNSIIAVGGVSGMVLVAGLTVPGSVRRLRDRYGHRLRSGGR